MIILLPKRFAVLKQAASFDHNSSTTSNRVNKAVLVHVEQTVTMHIVLEGPRSNFEIGGGGDTFVTQYWEGTRHFSY